MKDRVYRDDNSQHAEYEMRYQKIAIWFRKKQIRQQLLFVVYRYIPYFVAASYLYLIALCLYCKEWNQTIRVITVPAVSFLAVTIMRKAFNQPRPYTKYQIQPLIHKAKTGESFPSRHTLSVTIIAMSWMYVDIRIGIVLWILTLMIAASRVLSGVHFLKDVIAAVVISILFGWIGFYLI